MEYKFNCSCKIGDIISIRNVPNLKPGTYRIETIRCYIDDGTFPSPNISYFLEGLTLPGKDWDVNDDILAQAIIDREAEILTDAKIKTYRVIYEDVTECRESLEYIHVLADTEVNEAFLKERVFVGWHCDENNILYVRNDVRIIEYQEIK